MNRHESDWVVTQPPRRYQFSILRLLLLMTAIGVVFGLARSLAVTPLGQITAGVYFAVIAAWFIMRWHVVYVGLVEVRRRRHAMIRRRRALAADIEARRKAVAPQSD
jgi:hypothetical protein